MILTDTGIEGLIEIEFDRYTDSRGSFFESYNRKNYADILGEIEFVQDNCSISRLNVLRGLHLQLPPFAQAKLVSVVKGKVLDVALDLRKDSVTFGKHYIVELSDENNKQLFIPRGFAHGFCSLSEGTIFSYKCDNFYSKESEETILWNDPVLAIDWPDNDWVISDKDREGKPFTDFVSPF